MLEAFKKLRALIVIECFERIKENKKLRASFQKFKENEELQIVVTIESCEKIRK